MHGSTLKKKEEEKQPDTGSTDTPAHPHYPQDSYILLVLQSAVVARHKEESKEQ